MKRLPLEATIAIAVGVLALAYRASGAPMTFVLGYVAGMLSTLLLIAFLMGASRRMPEEQAAEDHAQQLALWPGYEEHA